jgi:CubicO group peptidase (beta-lactamase class C family)
MMLIEDVVAPEKVGLVSERVKAALRVIQGMAEPDLEPAAPLVPGATTAIFRHGKLLCLEAFGRRGQEADAPKTLTDTIFLIASLTKPVVCAGAMLLLEEGRLCLDQPVASFVPEFAAQGKAGVLVRHLLTHTSGLPDQLAQSPYLRHRQAPKEAYVQATCQTPLLFQPGTQVSYQSMGILMLGEIIERLTGQRLRDFLAERLFAPLQMTDSYLGLPPSGMERVSLILPPDFPPNSTDVGDDWNTPYWRDFGSPWGGLHSTSADLARFLMHISGDRPGPLSQASRAAMTRDQLAKMDIPASEALSRRWGLGFMLGAPYFGDLTSAGTFGHIGASGTLYWADPATHLGCVLLTNQPRRHWYLFERYSNAVAAALA